MAPSRWSAALAVLAFIGGPAASGAQERDLHGRVLAPDSTGLADVTVLLLPRGDSTTTRRDGRFVFRAVPRLPVRIAYRGPSIVGDTVQVAATTDSVTIIPRMTVELPGLEVSAAFTPIARERFEATAQTSTVSLDPLELTRAPALFEPDVVRVVQLLPGTVAKNDYSTGYNVRGGEADQNLVLLDGVPVFNPSHLGGLFSTFDANAVRRADFYQGGFPSWYPGRLSSVLDVELREGNPVGLRGQAMVSLLSSKVLIDGPLLGARYLIGARRTYADQVVKAFTEEELPYYFTDAVGKVTLGEGRRFLSITGYWGRDLLDLELVEPEPDDPGLRFNFDWGNYLVATRARRPFGTAGWVEVLGGVSEFSTTLGLLPDLGRFDNVVRVLTGQVTLAPDSGGTHDLRVGLDVQAHRMSYRAFSEALNLTLLDSRYRPTVWGAFLNDEWRAAKSLIVRPGMRLEYVTGADRVALSPRLAARWFVNPQTALTASVGRYHQAVHSIRDQEFPVTIFEFWIGADEFVPVSSSDHVVLGFERWLEDVQISLEGFRKTYDDLVTPNRAQNLRVRGDEFIPAEGTSWGLDLLIRKHAGPIRGWLAYGYARATRFAGGVEYPPAHDRRHTLNIVAFMPGPIGSEMSVRWGYGSPLPYTGIVGEWEHRRYDATNHRFDDFSREPLSTGINGERFPPYSRLDVGLRWDVGLFGARFQPYLQVANVYNRKNVFLYFFDYEIPPPRRTGVSQLPLLPSFGFEVSW